MTDKQPAVVWVLGAGFSRSLGGPLLKDFFTAGCSKAVTAALVQRRFASPEEEERELKNDLADVGGYGHWQTLSSQLHELYWGDDNWEREKEPARDRPWADPEQFVGYVVAAARDRGGKRWHGLTTLLNPVDDSHLPVGLLARACRTYLAAACWEFVADADTSSETWAPYLRWMRTLGDAGQTIVSFNYDIVCERLATDQRLRPWLQLPEVQIGDPEAFTGSTCLKLHGSVDWMVGSQPGVVSRVKDAGGLIVSALLDPKNEDDFTPALGVPGPGKVEAAHELFRTLWTLAEARLQNAKVVVFIGYSFPKSDNEAKMRLLNALSNNAARRLTVHVVLGPTDEDGTVARLQGLLEWALGRREILHGMGDAEAWTAEANAAYAHQVGGGNTEAWAQGYLRQPIAALVTHKLWAEDFLSVFEPQRLDCFRDFNGG